MTDKLLCPFCQQELRKIHPTYIICDNCRITGENKLWQELITTKKKLDRAIWWLNEIVENHRFTPISTAEKALAEINNKE